MRALATTLLVLGLLLGVARIFTGVVNGVSETTYFVAKGTPGLWMERAEINGPPVSADHVLDAEDGQLAYGPLYIDLMRATPWLLVVAIISSVILFMAGSRRRHRAA